MAKVYATGKRKTAVAKVWLKPGSGKILVNGLDLNTWLGGHEAIKLKVVQPLLLTKQESSVDVDTDFRATLKPKGLLTRDSRVVERKKFGRRKARRSPQFSKR